MEQDSVDDSLDADECGGDELDDSGFVVWSVYIPSVDWLGESVVGYLVFLDKAPIKAVDWGSAVNEGLGDDVFVKSVFEDRQGNVKWLWLFVCYNYTFDVFRSSLRPESSSLKILYMEFSNEFLFITYFFSLLHL